MNQELVDYIKQQMSLNVSKNKITDVLLGQGWQQPELDEAFAAAEGAANAGKVSFENSGSAEEDDITGEAPRGGGRKMVLIGVITLLVVLAAGGILILNSSGGDVEEPVIVDNTPSSNGNATNENNSEVAVADNGQPANDTGFGAQLPAVDHTATISSVTRLEGVITQPAGWELREGVKNNLPTVGYFKPEAEKDSAGKEIFNEFITVMTDSVKSSGATDAANYMTRSKEGLKANITNYEIKAEKNVLLSDGTTATLIGSSYTDDGIPMRSMQLFVFKDDEVYIISGFVLESNWEAEKDMMGAALLSFKFPVN